MRDNFTRRRLPLLCSVVGYYKKFAQYYRRISISSRGRSAAIRGEAIFRSPSIFLHSTVATTLLQLRFFFFYFSLLLRLLFLCGSSLAQSHETLGVLNYYYPTITVLGGAHSDSFTATLQELFLHSPRPWKTKNQRVVGSGSRENTVWVVQILIHVRLGSSAHF